MRLRSFAISILALIAMAPAGCGPMAIDTTYGRMRGDSVNGTGVLAAMLKGRGHEARAALRATEALGDWASVIVRFAPYPGPPAHDEAEWLSNWLQESPGRKLIYVPQDFDAESEFWAAMLAVQPAKADAKHLEQLRRNRDLSRSWTGNLPARSKTPADANAWFAVDPSKAGVVTCKVLGGPWSEEVDAGAAAVPVHDSIRPVEDEPVLLSGDGKPLAITWSYESKSEVLVLANASFLLNASLLNRARRPIAAKVADWVGPARQNVAFLEGASPVGEDPMASNSPFRLLGVRPFGWIGVHLVVFGLLFCLAMASTLGRARPDGPADLDRPSAHPEALGALLARTGRADAATFLLETYRRWRSPSHPLSRPNPAAPPPITPPR